MEVIKIIASNKATFNLIKIKDKSKMMKETIFKITIITKLFLFLFLRTHHTSLSLCCRYRQSFCRASAKLQQSIGGLSPKFQPCFRATHQSSFSTARNAFCGTSTLPICFMRFLPFFCFSSNLRLRLTSPP